MTGGGVANAKNGLARGLSEANAKNGLARALSEPTPYGLKVSCDIKKFVCIR